MRNERSFPSGSFLQRSNSHLSWTVLNFVHANKEDGFQGLVAVFADVLPFLSCVNYLKLSLNSGFQGVAERDERMESSDCFHELNWSGKEKLRKHVRRPSHTVGVDPCHRCAIGWNFHVEKQIGFCVAAVLESAQKNA